MTKIPPMAKVESTNMHAIGYDADTRDLHVRFKSGGHYFYSDVPPAKHEALMAAPSKTRYLRAEIIGKHTHTKMDADAG